MDQLMSGLVSVDAAYSASESLDAQCSIAMVDHCDYILSEFPLRYHVEIQRPLTTVAVVAALEIAAPIETDDQRAALLHEHAG